MNTNDKSSGSKKTVIVFYALITLAIGALIASFVYQNVTSSDAKYPFKLGLDLSGGSHLVYEADVSGIEQSDVSDLMNVLRDVIERRINVFGVSEPIVQVESSSFVSNNPSERLVVELPGVTDVSQAIDEIGKTPLLEFKLVGQNTATTSKATVSADGTINLNVGDRYIATGLTGRYLESAQLEFSGQSSSGGLSNQAVVSINFNNEGADLFEKITSEHVGESLAIFLDGEVISAPRINEPISGGQAVISGSFTPDEARNLAQNLNFGALPVPITLKSTETIGASLGGEVLGKGIKAGVLGFSFVMLFILLWYRIPGLVATVSLFFYVIGMLALFQIIPVTLTAAGLAGFILSLGMAVDANVLVFERMKEEYREGKDISEAARVGFKRAWSAIRDGNITSLLSAVILFWFGTSMVKGFALVFGIGVIMSMLSALIVTRTLLLALPNAKLGQKWFSFLYNSGTKLK